MLFVWLISLHHDIKAHVVVSANSIAHAWERLYEIDKGLWWRMNGMVITSSMKENMKEQENVRVKLVRERMQMGEIIPYSQMLYEELGEIKCVQGVEQPRQLGEGECLIPQDRW